MVKIKYLINITVNFTDKETGKTIHAGDTFETSDSERAKDIIVNKKLGKLGGVIHPNRKGNRILIHQKLCYKIGGIETANYNLAVTFKNRNLVFVFGDADENQLLRIAKYHDVIIDNGSRSYECDVAIFTNYDSAPEIMNRIKARKIYQQIHADFYHLKQMAEWRNFTWKPNPRIDKILSVSETAQNGLQRAFGLDSIVVPNLLPKLPNKKPMILVSLTRATPEKGIDKLVQLLKKLDKAKKEYILFLCSTIEQAKDSQQVYLRDNPSVVPITPHPNSIEMLKAADYLVQLSYNESYCYSVRQALQRGVPCIVSDIPELKKLIKDGKNGYIYTDDFDIKKLDAIPKITKYEEKVDPLWEQVLDGKIWQQYSIMVLGNYERYYPHI